MDRYYIEKIENIVEAKNYIEEIVKFYKSEEILCLFDVDQTILQPVNPACQIPNVKKHREIFLELKRKYAGFYPGVQGNFMLVEEHKILEEKILNLFTFLDEKKIKTLALTATPNICIENKDLREIRFQQLNEHNVNFEKAFPQKEIIFDNLNLFRGHPCFYKGIIFSNGNDIAANKGIVLHEFLKKINYEPKCIIFLDDAFKNHFDINQVLAEKNSNIDFYGIFYTASNFVKSTEVSEEEFKNVWENYFIRESASFKKIERRKF